MAEDLLQIEPPLAPHEEQESDAPEETSRQRTPRDRELSGRAAIEDKLLDVFKDVEKGFEDAADRVNSIIDHWNVYNLKLDTGRQTYNGNSQIFLPIVHDAIKARKTRFVNQLFPQSGRNVEVMSYDGTYPFAIMALAEHYIMEAKLRTEVLPALMVNGDVEGQYNLYVDWSETTRHTVHRESVPVQVDGVDMPEHGEIEQMIEETIIDGRPDVEVLSDVDVLILPVTANSVEEALEMGGSVTIARRWTKGQLKDMIARKTITREAGERLIEAMSNPIKPGRKDLSKVNASAAGIKSGTGGSKYALGYETWVKLKVDGERRLCRAYYGGERSILGCKQNPYWNDKCPLISVPVEKVAGQAKGIAPMKACVDLQIYANDMINEAADTAHFSAMPIILSDPEKNPGPMILGLAAIWKADPNSTKVLEFPALWRYGFEIIDKCKTEIFQTLGVNPSMVPQSTGKKMNQAEMANQQQVDLITTADTVTQLEQGVMTPLLQRFVDYDHQFRDKDLTVRAFGEMGQRAAMETVPPLQMNNRYVYRWSGVEQARNAAQVQQQIAAMNVLKGVPPQMIPGYKLNLAPIIVNLALSAFGSRMAPLVLEDLSKQQSIDAGQENEILKEGMPVNVHPPDDDAKHIAEHVKALRETGDPMQVIRAHIQAHQTQMQAKNAQQQQMMQAQGGKGAPGGPGGAGPGVAGTPAPGGQAEPPRPMRGPPGMIPQDQMGAAGAVVPPRSM